jgi:hypothetical protein
LIRLWRLIPILTGPKKPTVRRRHLLYRLLIDIRSHWLYRSSECFKQTRKAFCQLIRQLIQLLVELLLQPIRLLL